MADEETDFYELLGVDLQVTPDGLKAAFHGLAQKYHPDKGGSDPEHIELFKRITEAYRVLSDPERRNDYNREKGYQFHEEIDLGGLGEPQFPPPKKKVEEKKSVDLGSEEPRDWSHLRGVSDVDLKVDHKLALTPEEEMEEARQAEPEVAAWGEEEDAGGGGMFRRRRSDAAMRRAELKKNLKATISEENQPSQPGVVQERAQRPQRPKSVELDEDIENPFKEQRIFNFQISALEAALGTNRELVLSAGSSERPNKLEFDIPAGIEEGTVMEVSRGWDRAKVRISVVQDPLFIVEGNDIHLRIPVTIKEALDGAEIAVPGVDQVNRVQLRAGADSTEVVRVPDAGISRDGETGDLYVKPVIVAPMQVTETLRAAAKVVEAHAQKAPRSKFESDPSNSEFVRIDPDKVTVYLPISFTEAIEGAELSVPVLDSSVSIRIPSPWDYTKEILLADLQPSHGKLVAICPEVSAPSRSS